MPAARDLVTHGDRQLPIAPDLDDSRLQAALGPIPRTPLRDGIAETYRRFVALREQGGSIYRTCRPNHGLVPPISDFGVAPRPIGLGRRRPPPAAAPREAAGAGSGKRSLGIGLMSILACFRSALTTFF